MVKKVIESLKVYMRYSTIEDDRFSSQTNNN